MKSPWIPGCLAGVLTAALILPGIVAPASQNPTPDRAPAAVTERAKQFTEPGPNHKVLERFVGEWTAEVRLFQGEQASPPSPGKAEARWLMPGRWVQMGLEGTLLGRPMQSSTIVGYDNFKQSFVMTVVHSTDTAMLRAEGDLTRDGKELVAYGTMDEYLTGEHDKMVKYVYRFVSPDEIIFEVHDLHIGEPHTKVVEIRYRRKE